MNRILAAAGLALALASCTTASLEFPDGSKVSFTRTMTSAGVHVKQRPDGSFELDYSSDPQAQAVSDLTAAAARVSAAAVALASGQASGQASDATQLARLRLTDQ